MINMFESVLLAVVAGGVVGIVVVEYSRWRYSRMVRKLIKELLDDDNVDVVVKAFIRKALEVLNEELRPKELDNILKNISVGDEDT